jgi:hypothetical protein
MENRNQNFDPKVLIVEHFDEKINQIDIKTETILAEQEKKINSHEHETKRMKINEVRAKQIEKLKELKEINLSHLTNLFFQRHSSNCLIQCTIKKSILIRMFI